MKFWFRLCGGLLSAAGLLGLSLNVQHWRELSARDAGTLVLLLSGLFLLWQAGRRAAASVGSAPPAALPLPLFKVLLAEHEEQCRQQAAQAADQGLQPISLNAQDLQKYNELAATFQQTDDPQKQTQLQAEMRALDEKLVTGFYDELHARAKADPRQRRAALCFSGGGVRSATYALGLLQGLVRQGVGLSGFHFLSTVSGGGYTGSWLSVWAHRVGLAEVETALHKPQSPLVPEPQALRHLRQYSNPLTPSLGLMAADTWTLVGIYLRNLALNWSVLLPLLMVFLALPRLVFALVCWTAAPPLLRDALPVVALGLGWLSVAYFVMNRPSMQRLGRALFGKPAWQRNEVEFLWYGLLPLLLEALLMMLYWAWTLLHFGAQAKVEFTTRWWCAGLALLSLGALARLVWRSRDDAWFSGKTIFAGVSCGLALVGTFAGSWLALPRALTLSLTGPLLFILFAFAKYIGGIFISWLVSGRWDRRELLFSLALTSLLGGLFFWGAARLNTQLVQFAAGPPAATRAGLATPAQPDKQLVKLSAEPLTLTLETDSQKQQTALKLAAPVQTELQKGQTLLELQQATWLRTLKRVGWYVVFAPPLFVLAFLAAATLFIGLASGITTDADREWMARAGAWMLLAGLLWIIVSTTVLFGAEWIWRANVYAATALLTAGSGLTTLVLGWLPTTAANEQRAGAKAESRLPKLILPLASVIFALALFAWLALATDGFLHSGVVQWLYVNCWPAANPLPGWLTALPVVTDVGDWHWLLLAASPWPFVLLGVLVLLGVGGGLGVFVNINKFSLHAANRDRLIRAYLGASNPQRRPNPFTGFDQRDDVQMHELLEPLFTKDSFASAAQFDQFVKWLKEAGDELRAGAPGMDAASPGQSAKLARLLWQEFAPSTQTQVEHYNGTAFQTDAQTEELKNCLAQELNRVIHGDLLIPWEPQPESLLQRVLAKLFYRFKHADGVFSEKEVTDFWSSLSAQEKAQAEQFVPLFPGLPGALALKRRSPVKRLRLNRRVLEQFCQANDQPFLKACEDVQPPAPRPFHVVNMALNLVNGKELAWQERKARSFFATPLHVGAPGVGLRLAEEYGITFDGKGALTLGTALAISGAAANPNAGYYSSPLVTFFLTFFNVRLGWWLGNPGVAGQTTYRASSPFFAPNVLLAETFGFTDDTHPYVNLSDGGHFDNLGLYEMVRRRCHFIIVSDAGQDDGYSYADLGIALRLIYADLGVPIHFKTQLPKAKPTADTADSPLPKLEYFALAEIDYKAIDGEKAENGVLVLMKPALHGNEPADVYSYARSNPAFPNDPTFTDQFFSESQFESYRHLGEYAVTQLLKSLHWDQPASLPELAQQALNQPESCQRKAAESASGSAEAPQLGPTLPKSD